MEIDIWKVTFTINLDETIIVSSDDDTVSNPKLAAVGKILIVVLTKSLTFPAKRCKSNAEIGFALDFLKQDVRLNATSHLRIHQIFNLHAPAFVS